MNLINQIEHAFGHRLKPSNVVDARNPVGSDERDALWFAGRSWQEVTWESWEDHSGALYAFTPEAFAYYLPSILSLSSLHPEKWLGPADTLLRVLDRSPLVEHWDSFIATRLVGLQTAEYEALKEWLLSLSGHKDSEAEDALGRALETVDLLLKETNRVRALIGSDSDQS